MGNVFFSVSMSLDGYMAPEDGSGARRRPNYHDWLRLWSDLQKWVEQQQFFRENLKLGEGGELARTTASLRRLSTVPA